MPEIVRGYSRKGRKLSAAIFIPLSVLFLALTAVYDGETVHVAVAGAMVGLSLILLTPLWRAFYPVAFVIFGVPQIWSGIATKHWDLVVSGAYSLFLALLFGWLMPRWCRMTNN